MKAFRDKYLGERPAGAWTNVLDIGAKQVRQQETYRPLFEKFHYVGMDVEAGKNVDLIVANPDKWPEVMDRWYPVIISGQMLEHAERPWVVFREMARILALGGIMCVIAPWKWKPHRYPVDCYRYLPDGMKALGDWAGLTVADTFMDGNDCVGIFKQRE
jgi:SAM-dependent methyltransferase